VAQVVAAWLAKQSEPWQVVASVSQGGRREEIKGKEKKKRKGRGLLAKKMGCTRLGQTGDLGRAEENGTGLSKGELGCVKEKKKASGLHKKNQRAEEFGLDSKE
jgi:hypothetical protein